MGTFGTGGRPCCLGNEASSGEGAGTMLNPVVDRPPDPVPDSAGGFAPPARGVYGGTGSEIGAVEWYDGASDTGHVVSCQLGTRWVSCILTV